MRSLTLLSVWFAALPQFGIAQQVPLLQDSSPSVSLDLFNRLEEHARLVDIAYCVGTGNTGISKPFTCLSRCSEFPSFELITTWNTGPLLTDSCGYIALSHEADNSRIIVAFRGTYSIANAVMDLATVRQEYLPYRANNNTDDDAPKCNDCAVHMGFFRSWQAASEMIMPYIESLQALYPDHELTLIGHSLGGAVAALAGLEMDVKGWNPHVTTFGEPRVGNAGLAQYIDARFGLAESCNGTKTEHHRMQRYRRVTHVDDPIPLLPLSEWGFMPQGGEVFINKSSIPPAVEDLQHCCGNIDKQCIAGQDDSLRSSLQEPVETMPGIDLSQAVAEMAKISWAGLEIPARYKLWQLLFAHRDYFWRLGLCVPELRSPS